MKQAYIFLTDGFEEIEALGTIDILRRAGVSIQSVSLTGRKDVTGSHNITVEADTTFTEANFERADILILPGGTPKINEYDNLKELIVKFNDRVKPIAAICAAPMVLGGMGLLKGKRATAYPGFEKYLTGAEFVVQPVVVDGNIITGRGPGFTMEFALKIVEILMGVAKRDEVAEGLLLK